MMSVIIEFIDSQITTVILNFNGTNGTGGPGTQNANNGTNQGNVSITTERNAAM